MHEQMLSICRKVIRFAGFGLVFYQHLYHHLLVNTLSVLYSEGQIGLSLGSEGQPAYPLLLDGFFQLYQYLIQVPRQLYKTIWGTLGMQVWESKVLGRTS